MIDERWELSDEEKEAYIQKLMPLLGSLRARAGISQEEMSHLVGISRQTYGTAERGFKGVSWSTYLSLLFFFDYNRETHEMLHASGAFPTEIIRKLNFRDPDSEPDLTRLLISANVSEDVLEVLDDHALRSIRTMIMLEYARCSGLNTESVIKAFDGVDFKKASDNAAADGALASIKKKRKRKKSN